MPPADASRSSEPGLFDYAAILWRRKWVVVITVVVAVAIAVAIDQIRTPVYSATSSIELLSQSTSPQAGGAGPSATQLATDVALAEGTAVHTAASRILKQPAPPVTVQLVGATAVATMTVDSTSPALAADAANAYAQAYIAVTREEYVQTQNASESGLNSQIQSLQSQIQTVSTQLAQAPSSSSASNLSGDLTSLYTQKAQLQTELAQLQLAASQSANGASLVSSAVPPSSPSSPKTTRDALIALAAGLVAGIGLAFLWDLRDDRIRSRQDLEETLGGLPAIGVIPLIGDWKDRKAPYLISSDRPKSPTAEAYRALRTSIRFISLDENIRKLVVTSPAAADGKTTTSANLAITMAQAGQRVILVGCDLRRPRIQEFFGASNSVGFTSLLLGEHTLDEALQHPVQNDGVILLPSGPVPPNPSELLASGEAGRVIDQLTERADMVILDCPPVLPVTDAAVLAGQADGVLLVTSAGITMRRDTRRSLEILHRVDARVIGAVLNRATEVDAYAYYRYGYGYGYGGREEAATAPLAVNGAAVESRTNGNGTAGNPGDPPGAGPAHVRRRRNT